MDMMRLREELRGYYSRHSVGSQEVSERKRFLFQLMDEHAARHPGHGPMRLKAAQYEIIADNFQPVIFKNSPFYSEMGVKAAEYSGTPGLGAGGWLWERKSRLFRDANPQEHDQYVAAGKNGVHLVFGPYVEQDHHCFPYSNVLKNGLSGIYKQAGEELARCGTKKEAEFIECAMRGILAVKKISEKFALAAEESLKEAKDHEQRRFLSMMAAAAGEVPWRRPETFYECLSAIWFLHEACASIEGVGISVIGHLDKMAGGFYRRDTASGRLSPKEAYDLVRIFLLHTEAKLDLSKPVAESFNRQEQGDTLVLGGCDENGSEICDEVTLMTLRAHHELKLTYPKIHCRISANSSQALLDAANRDFLSGRNVISFLSDDAVIPAQERAGKRLEDARRYVAGGCWEVIVEGCEHSAGANCYFNLARVMDMTIRKHRDVEAETGYVCDSIEDASDFEEVRRVAVGNVVRILRRMCEAKRKNGGVWPLVNPAPFFSACLSDCLKNRRDYTEGGGRYNPHGLPLTGFAIFVNSLLAIRKLCFETKRHSLKEILEAARADWKGHEALRAEAMAAPHFGDNTAESNELASQILDEIHGSIQDLVNERGGGFQLGFYSYRDIIDWAKITQATPDGRRAGDFLTQGLTPSRLHSSQEATSALNAASALDLGKCPANSVMTLSLPLGGVTLQTLGHFERAFAKSGLGMLQLNCVDREQLLDAQKHPERHQDLIVRLYGYSARFVNLTPEMQEEFIGRIICGESA